MQISDLKIKNKEIAQQFRKFGIRSPAKNYSYIDILGNLGFQKHTLKTEKLLDYYRQLGDPEMIQQMEKWVWYYEARAIYKGGIQRQYNIHYSGVERDTLTILQIMQGEQQELDKERFKKLIQKIGEKGYQKELKCIRLMLTSNYQAANAAMEELMDQIDWGVDQTLEAVNTDLKKRIKQVMEAHTED